MDKKLLDKLNGFNLSMQQKMQLVELIQEASGGASNGGGTVVCYSLLTDGSLMDATYNIDGEKYNIDGQAINNTKLYNILLNKVRKGDVNVMIRVNTPNEEADFVGLLSPSADGNFMVIGAHVMSQDIDGGMSFHYLLQPIVLVSRNV